MTVSANFTANPTVEQIIKAGMQLAGLLRLGGAPRAEQMSDARVIFDTRIKELQAKGVILATEERATLALVSGQTAYALAADTIDIDGDAMVRASGATSRTQVLQIPFANYNMLSDLTVTGTPTQFYVEKQATVQALFWPVPNAAMTLDYRRIRLLRDVDSGGVTADLWQRGLRLLTLYVAHDAAMNGNIPMNKISYLATLVMAAEKTLLGDAHEKGDVSFHF